MTSGTAQRFTVSARRVVQVAPYSPFEFSLAIEIEPDPTAKLSDQISFWQDAVRQKVQAQAELVEAE